MYKEFFVSNITTNLSHHFSSQQIQLIENSIRFALLNVDIVPLSTEISVSSDVNNKILDIFLASKKIEGTKLSTLKQYKWTVQRFFRETNKNYFDVTKNDVKIWLATRSKDLSRNSLINNKRNLQSFFNWLADENYISSNPVKPIKTMKEIRPENVHMNQEEESLVRDYICRDCVPLKHRAIVSFLLSTGLRVGEIASLNRSDVDFSNGTVTFRGEKSDRIRTVFLDVRAKRYLCEYVFSRNDTNPSLFVTHRLYNGYPKRLSKSRYESIVKSVCTYAGVTGKICTVHVFRRTFATRLADAGCPLEVIQELLGHANSDTTSKCYVAQSTKRTRQKVEQYLMVA